MQRPTYGDFYEEGLEEAIESYGDSARIVTLVEMYRKHDVAARSLDFAEWLTVSAFSCARCGVEFQPEYGGAEEDDEIVCPRCVGGR